MRRSSCAARGITQPARLPLAAHPLPAPILATPGLPSLRLTPGSARTTPPAHPLARAAPCPPANALPAMAAPRR